MGTLNVSQMLHISVNEFKLIMICFLVVWYALYCSIIAWVEAGLSWLGQLEPDVAISILQKVTWDKLYLTRHLRWKQRWLGGKIFMSTWLNEKTTLNGLCAWGNFFWLILSHAWNEKIEGGNESKTKTDKTHIKKRAMYSMIEFDW